MYFVWRKICILKRGEERVRVREIERAREKERERE